MKKKTHLKARIFALLGCIAVLAAAMAVPISATVLVADSNINFFNLGAFTHGQQFSFDDGDVHYMINTNAKNGRLAIYALDEATDYFNQHSTVVFQFPYDVNNIIPQLEADQYYYSGYEVSGGDYSVRIGFADYGGTSFLWELGGADRKMLDEDQLYTLKNDDYYFTVIVTANNGWKYGEEGFISFSLYIDYLQITQNYNIIEKGIAASFKEYNATVFDVFNDVYESAYNDGYSDGEQEGYNNGEQEGYDNGYDAGYADGQQNGSGGYDEGFEAGYTEGKLDGNVEGYEVGFEEGKTTGYTEGQDAGYKTGYAAGEAAGEKAGYDTGYKEGYVAGTSAGSEEAYEKGYQDAVDVYNGAELNIFEDCTLTVEISTTQSHVYMPVDYAPFTYTSSGIKLADAYDYAVNQMQSRYSDFDITKAESVTYTFTFNGQFIYSNGTITANMPIGINTKMFATVYGEYDSGAAAYYDVTAKTIGANGYTLELADANAPDPAKLLVQKITITFLTLESTSTYLNYAKNLTLKTDAKFTNNSYRTGYLNGYTNGYDEGVVQAQELAFDEGYNTGFTSGKQEGLQIAGTGTWRELMLSVVEAPINTFQSLFNFEILGLDMRVAFGSILTVCVLLIIMKKAM